jgi:hypothetical protein
MDNMPPQSHEDHSGAITRSDAKALISAYNTDGISKHPHPDYPNEFISGYSFSLGEMKAIVDFLESLTGVENKDKRVFFGYGYHHAGENGADKTGHTLIAAPMIFGPYDPETEAAWHIPNHAELYDYCEPCPKMCPKVNLSGEDGDWQNFKNY